ncbi:spore coat U domain-containing protein [Idiomarina xiamenensis]|uniref:Putative type 1 pili pilus subunit n=1 Tax=Idiomarina xiamenensis 10-D-4 TaxID=740709 RepID=K2K3C6_9GAMM|nr:spore coat U domain-containing protein [Idiomarina xiamenensis]EKE82113.1 putative type 1 pili pilus subunit [Idiomarina xiamenensis 10-D-4]
MFGAFVNPKISAVGIALLSVFSTSSSQADSGVNDRTVQQSSVVRLSVAAYCEFPATVAGGDFGNLDFGELSSTQQYHSTQSQIGAGSVVFRCTPGESIQVLMNQGSHGSSINQRQMQSAAGATLDYQLYSDAQRSQVWDNQTGVSVIANGQQQSLTVYGEIAPQATPAAGTYQDQVTVTIVY